MTAEELQKKARIWERQIEDMVIEMARVTTVDGLLVYFTPEKIFGAFQESLDALIHNHATGSAFVTGHVDEEGESAAQEDVK